MGKSIVVIGGGPAAVFAALEAKKTDTESAVTLLSNEASYPYEKPPLSKAVLLGKAMPEDAPIGGEELARRGVAVMLNTRCAAIDRNAHEVVTPAGRLKYDSLVIATGSALRELPALPMSLPGVHYLRTDAHAHALKLALSKSQHLVVVGAGLIGLEVAASAVKLGLKVTVIEQAPRIMHRTCDAESAAFIMAEHLKRGVNFKFSTMVEQAKPQQAGDIALHTSDGAVEIADLVVVGAGTRPHDAIGLEAGLDVQDGVVVDAHCRTSDPDIHAAGDVARLMTSGGSIRLENWRHAQDHGMIAGRNAAGANDIYDPVPSYWSEQYELFIQGVGWMDASAQSVRRTASAMNSLAFQTQNSVVTFALGINAQRDIAAARRLIERKLSVDPAALADSSQPLNAMLKPKAPAL